MKPFICKGIKKTFHFFTDYLDFFKYTTYNTFMINIQNKISNLQLLSLLLPSAMMAYFVNVRS